MDIVAGEKTREGRPFYGQYTEVQVGQYRNFGCPFYWVVVRIASIDVFTNLTEMVKKCGWRSLMPRCSSPQKCISAYLKFKGMDIYKHSKWVAFTVEVLEYVQATQGTAVCIVRVRMCVHATLSSRRTIDITPALTLRSLPEKI